MSLIVGTGSRPLDVHAAAPPPCPEPPAPVVTPPVVVPSEPDAPLVVAPSLPPDPVWTGLTVGVSVPPPPHASIPAPQPRATQKPITREDSILVMVLASLSVALQRSGYPSCRTPGVPSPQNGVK